MGSHVLVAFAAGVGVADALKVQSMAQSTKTETRKPLEFNGMVLDDAFFAQVRALSAEQTMYNPNAANGDDDSDDSLTKAEIDAEIEEMGCRKISSTTNAWNST